MSSEPLRERSSSSPAEIVAGYVATLAIFASLISIVWHPLRLVLVSMLLALLAAAMGGRNTRIAFTAVVIAALSFFFGMIVAVVFTKPLW